MRDATDLGASLYVPTTRSDLHRIVSGELLHAIRSIIFCTEDSVKSADLPLALNNLRKALAASPCGKPQIRFVRVRNPQVMREVLAMPGVDSLDGFVLPKVTKAVLLEYVKLLRGRHHMIMPTLETREVFEEREMIALRRILEQEPLRGRVLSLRIGGNDLLSLLGLRRPRGRTLYETSLGPVIARLVTTFRPSGFNLTAPVFEYLEDVVTLQREIDEDVAHGLVGKTAVHPEQVPIIEACYRVHACDLEMANRILSEDAPAVFRMHDSMCEPATHSNWARRLQTAASRFGTRDEATVDSMPS